MINKLFGTDGVRGTANIYPMTAGFAFDLAEILSQLVCKDTKTVAIGKDTRISGDMLEAALSAGFTSNGISVISLGVVPTPLVTLSTKKLNVDMALMITASHNPYHDNGIKLIDRNGDKFSDELYAQIEGLLEQKNSDNHNNKSNNKNNNHRIDDNNNKLNKSPSSLGYILKDENVIEDYIQNMRHIAPSYKSFQGLKVVLDCANGSYFSILPQTFKDLGATVIVINNKPNGYNINENCGSQHTKQLSEMVLSSQAHFGVAVDGDGDRIILVDNNGTVIDGDQLLCFLAQYLKKHNKLTSNTVISTEWSNLGLGKYFETQNIHHIKSKVGERYVIDLMKENKSSLGGELVGHIVLSDYAVSGDALATAIVLSLAYLEDGRQMSDIFPIFSPYPCIIENIRFSTKEYMSQSIEYPDVQKALADAKKLLGADSNLIARKSGTEPVIKLRVEGTDEKLVQKLAAELKALIQQYQK
ncbi:MAG: phosphoglucosamine mutase [Acetobacter sp.]|nr:phosphoglucosamine mutase [Acetobacter sp.]